MKKGSIVENNEVINVIILEDDDNFSDYGAVDLGNFAEIGDTVANNVSIQASSREEEYYRGERNDRLAQTDFYALSDVTMPDEIATYRQALRDLPASDGWFENITWPADPTANTA